MTLFWILWAFDGLIALVILYFFIIGLVDGSVSSFNIELWFLILLVVGGVMLGSLGLVKHHHYVAAKLALCVLALPGFVYGIFMLMLMGVKDWK